MDRINQAASKRSDEAAIATVNGHAIRTVGTRFGRLYAVGGTDMAFSTLAQAKKYAESI